MIFAAAMVTGCLASFFLIHNVMMSFLIGLTCLAFAFVFVVVAYRVQSVAMYEWVLYLLPIVDIVYKLAFLFTGIVQIYQYRDTIKETVKVFLSKLLWRNRVNGKLLEALLVCTHVLERLPGGTRISHF